MTFQISCFIEFSDLLGLQYTCRVNGCTGRAIQPINEQSPVYRCPVCNVEWLNSKDSRIQIIQQLVHILRELSKQSPSFLLNVEVTHSKMATFYSNNQKTKAVEAAEIDGSN